MQKSILIVLLLSTVCIAQAERVKDTLYTIKVKARKASHRFTIYAGTGYRHASTISSTNYTVTKPMSMLNVQYGISQRWSAGLVGSYFSFERHREAEVKHSSTLGLGFKLDYALVHKERFEVFLSGNISNQHYRRKYYTLSGRQGSSLNEDQNFVQLTPGFNLGFNWFPTKHIGLFGQVGHGLSLAEAGIALKF